MPRAKKLPSGSWNVRVYDHTEYVNGKRRTITKSITVDDPSPQGRRECERQAAVYAAYKDRIAKNDITVGEAIKRYIDERTNVLSEATIKSYLTKWNNDYKGIQNIRIKELTQDDVQRWVNAFKRTHSAKSVLDAHTLLSSSLSVALPSLRLRTTLPKLERKRKYIPDDDAVIRLLKVTRGSEMEKAILLAAYGGLRRGEVCALRAEDIRGNEITVHRNMIRGLDGKFLVKSPKNGNFRIVTVPTAVIEEMPLIGRVVNLDPDMVTYQFAKAVNRAGIPHCSFHSLRHYFASVQHALGIPDQYIMEAGGWTSDQVMKTVYRNTFDSAKKHFSDIANDHFQTMLDTKLNIQNEKSPD